MTGIPAGQTDGLTLQIPCSEYMFLDDTACNLASLNLTKFVHASQEKMNVDAYLHAVRLWTLTLEISVLMAQFPSREIAQNSYNYRTLGLGYANLGALLMIFGISYDSNKGRNLAAVLSSLMTGECYRTSAELAKEQGPFKRFDKNRATMLSVIRNHRRAVFAEAFDSYENLATAPQAIDPNACPRGTVNRCQRSVE